MVRNNLELARDSLLIRNIKNEPKVTGLLSVHDADPIIITSEPLPHPLWLNHLNFPFILKIDTEHHYRMNIHALLDGIHSQRHLGSFSKSV